MAIAKVQSASGSGITTALTVNYGVTPTDGNLLVAIHSWCHNTTSSGSITETIDNGASKAIKVSYPGDVGNEINGLTIWYKIASSDTTDVTVGYSGASKKGGLVLSEWSDINATPLDITKTGNGSAATFAETAATGTLAQADELMIFGVGWGNDLAGGDSWSHSFADIEPFLAIGGASTDMALAGGFQIVSSTSSVTPRETLTSDTDNYIAAVATFKAAGGAPASNPKGPFGHPFHGPFAGPVGP